MTQTRTCTCGQPAPSSTLCKRCAHTLDVALANIRAYYADAEISLTRRRAVRYDLPRGTGGSKSMPLPVDARFLPDARGTQAMRQARTAVTTWVRRTLAAWPPLTGQLVCDDALCRRCSRIRHERLTRTPPGDTIASCCAYLQRLLPKIAAATWADQLLAELLDVERALARIDARGPERIYAGECTVCLAVYQHTRLYALPGDEWVTCPADDCGMEYRVEERRDLMRDAIDARLCTAAEIASLATYLELLEDRERTRKRINLWRTRGLLQPASASVDGEPVYPFGDTVRLLVAADSVRRATRKGA